jgi:poly(3-hydroxybutyrate) depolymerase
MMRRHPHPRRFRPHGSPPRTALGAAAAVAVAVAAAVIAGGACKRTEACRPGTVFLRVELGQTGRMADTIELRTRLDPDAWKPPVALTVPAGSTSVSLELKFEAAYPANRELGVSLRALRSGVPQGDWTPERLITLRPGCTAETDLSLDQPQPDGGTDGPPADAPAQDGGGDGGADSGADTDADADAGDDGGGTPACPPNQHACGESCVPNDDVRTCGSSCSPCEQVPDGTPTCDGTRCGAACPADKQLCRGACIDKAATCDGTCPPGAHECGGQCPSDQNVNACGTSCNPCPVPADAVQATCDGTACGFQCRSGFHRCGARCASDSDAAACGAACQTCPGDPNGSARCVGGSCTVACSSGYHLCGSRCVSNTSPDSCGTSCAPCTPPAGGTSACVQGMCEGRCPTGQELCLGSGCIPTGSVCNGQCPQGTHACGGSCSSNTAVNSCGPTSCTPCPRPTGAAGATCNGTTCDFTCGSGYHRCGSGCAADSDAAACGTGCTRCPTDPNGTAGCQGGSCTLGCNSGYHLCAGRCVDNRAVANCGLTSCTACQAPTGGTVSCDGLACVPTCPTGTKLCSGACIASTEVCGGCTAGTHNCGGVCVSNMSVDSCGGSCTPCSAPPANGRATCNGTSCGITCDASYHNCSGACVSNASVASCGPTSCMACLSPTDGTATCNGTSCGVMCNSGFILQGTTCVPASPGCGRTGMATGLTSGSVTVDGQQRTYALFVPAGYNPATPYPLIFGWHGIGQSGSMAHEYLGVVEASAGQAILVYPDAPSSQPWEFTAAGKDVRFFDALVADVPGRYCIQPKRIFSAGFSMGGGLSHLLGCYRGNVLRAIAGSSAFATSSASGCTGEAAVWLAAGTADGSGISYSQPARDFWLGRNGCSTTTQAVTPSPCVAYSGCAADLPVHWCLIAGGMHVWPAFAGAGIWSFFDSFR